jgi:ferredoxin-NADP reductase
MANPIKIPASVAAIHDFSDGIFTLILSPQKRIPKFKPGQFLHLAIDDYDPAGGFWPDSRVFSIASNPDDATVFIAFSVKGKFTNRMRSEIAVGKTVWLKFPYGDFIIDSIAGAERDVILVAGGTGITPYLSFLSQTLRKPSNRKISLFYGVRKISHVICGDIIGACLNSLPGFSLHFFVEENLDPGKIPFGGKCGSLKASVIASTAKNLVNPIVFLSGPPQMISAFKKDFIEGGIDPKNIAIDEWE